LSSGDLWPMLFADEELEDENPEIVLRLSRLARRAVSWLSTEVVDPITRRRDELRRLFEPARWGGGEAMVAAVAAIDSTWSMPPLDLVSGTLAIIVAGFIIVAPNHPGFHGISYVSLGRLSREESVGRSVELRSKILEMETCRRFVLGRYAFVDMVLIDGPLFVGALHPAFYSPASTPSVIESSRRAGCRELASYLARAVIECLSTARDLDKPVVGVVKRVSSKFLVPQLVDKGLEDAARAVARSNDKTLMSYILEPGEYVTLGSFRELLERYLEWRGSRRVLKALRAACDGSLGPGGEELCRLMEDTAVVYYMPPRDLAYPQATRLDIYPSTAVETVIDYVMHETSHNAVPTPIDLVDRYVRIESTSIRRFHNILRSLGEGEVSKALSFTNPQKSYLHEELRRHRERRYSSEHWLGPP